jgi:hypothetical protein
MSHLYLPQVIFLNVKPHKIFITIQVEKSSPGKKKVGETQATQGRIKEIVINKGDIRFNCFLGK